MPSPEGGDDFLRIGGPSGGRGASVVLFEQRLMAAWRSATERNAPIFGRCFVSVAKYPLKALSQEAEVGVKWKVQRR
jgi:hypothetical protein